MRWLSFPSHHVLLHRDSDVDVPKLPHATGAQEGMGRMAAGQPSIATPLARIWESWKAAFCKEKCNDCLLGLLGRGTSSILMDRAPLFLSLRLSDALDEAAAKTLESPSRQAHYENSHQPSFSLLCRHVSSFFVRLRFPRVPGKPWRLRQCINSHQ